MKISTAGSVVAALVTVGLGISLAVPDAADVQTQMVVTARPSKAGAAPVSLAANDLTVRAGKTSLPVVRLDRLAGDMAGMQLFIFLDDATRSSALGDQLGQLKTFVQSLPASTQVAVGYMKNGGVALKQGFTTDHAQAAGALGLPMAMPGVNGNPYVALSELVKHWPSQEATNRRGVLMLTDGVDRYWGARVVNDPYVEASARDALKAGVTVYSIYLRGAGFYGESDYVTNIAQSRLEQVSEETGGKAWSEGLSNPVEISPFLKDFSDRLRHQYRVTVDALNRPGIRPVKVKSELPGLKVQAPKDIFVR